MNTGTGLLGWAKITLLAALLIIQNSVVAETTSKIGGTGYADYYNYLQHNNADQKGQNAFQYRRIYFTYENNLRSDIKIRFRLESKHEGYGTKAEINPFVKHAFLEWSDLVPNHSLIFGIQETNAFKNAESIWGYRSIEKTIMDFYKISSSADMGFGIKGDFNKYLHHWLTVTNGTGYSSAELDPFKKVGYAFWITPADGLIIEGYADYEKQDPDNSNTKGAPSAAKDFSISTGYYTLKTTIAYEQPNFAVALEAFSRTNKQSGIINPLTAGNELVGYDKADVNKIGYSIFGTAITPVPRLKAFARYDYYDPNTGDNVITNFKDGTLTTGLNNEESMLVVGLDYIPAVNVHFMPNVIVTSYTAPDKKTDVLARVTLWFNYDSGKLITE